MKTWFWQAIAAAAASITAASAADANEPLALLPSPLMIPKRIGPMEYTGTPHKYDDPRLGVSYQYGGDGLSLTVYVYNAGETDLADGADTRSTCREFEIAKEGVEQAYQKVQLRSEQLARLNPPHELPQMREALYEFEREGNPTISFIWITSAAKHFVKLRLSMNPRLRDELPEARRTILSVMGEAIQPHLAPVDPKAEAPGTTMGFTLGGGSDDELQAGILYLMLMSTAADQVPEQAPVCGGEFVPSLEAEAGVYRGMFALGEVFAGTRFGKRIGQIDQAGFLEEFLWVEKHREAWGTSPPPALMLPEYQAWKKKNLKRFKPPDFGTITLDHPRPLPLEPVTP